MVGGGSLFGEQGREPAARFVLAAENNDCRRDWNSHQGTRNAPDPAPKSDREEENEGRQSQDLPFESWINKISNCKLDESQSSQGREKDPGFGMEQGKRTGVRLAS